MEPRGEGEREGNGRLTMTRLRKILELASKADLYKEFKLRFLYLVSRNKNKEEKELESFAKQFIRELENEKEENRLGFAKLTLEYALMKYAAKELEGRVD